MRPPAFLLQFSRKGYEAAISKGLGDAWKEPVTEREWATDSGAGIAIFSDMHKGARDDADDYWRCERAYRAALAYYYEADYHLFVLGDAEELWENRPGPVLTKHAPTLDLEAKFHAEQRYVRFWGNHDADWSEPAKVRDGLDPLFKRHGGEPLEVQETLKLRVTDRGEPIGLVFLVHGHQGTYSSDTAGPVAKFFVRNVWRNVQRLTRLPSTTPATRWRLREKHDRAMATWIENFGAELDEPLVLIAGHTHRPVFGSELLEPRVVAELKEEGEKSKPNRNRMNELSAKLEWYRAWRNWRDPHELGQAPAYFNTGCCAFPDGDITGLELSEGQIRLVRWPERAPEREVLAEDELVKIFRNLNAAAGSTESTIDGASAR